MIKVYISCPYSKGDIEKNVEESMRVTNELINNGFIPFNPLYSHFQHTKYPQPYEKWLELDLEWLRVCNCVLRLPGESNGADKEVKLAKELGMSVYYSLEELIKECQGRTEIIEKSCNDCLFCDESAMGYHCYNCKDGNHWIFKNHTKTIEKNCNLKRR